MFVHLTRSLHTSIWKQVNALATPGCSSVQHFFETTEAYVNSVSQEAEDRMHNRVHSVDGYLRLRRDTSAARTVVGLHEIGLGLPNEVLFHPTLVSLTQDAIDMIVI